MTDHTPARRGRQEASDRRRQRPEPVQLAAAGRVRSSPSGVRDTIRADDPRPCRRRLARPRRSPTSGATTTSPTSRAVARMAAALGEHGGIVERVEVRGDRNQAGVQIGQLQQLVTTQSMFGGGSLAVVTNAGALAVRNEDRAGLSRSCRSSRRAAASSSSRRRRAAPASPGRSGSSTGSKAAGGEIRGFKAPKAGELAGWIEAEARERGMRLGPGARAGARRRGSGRS